MAKAKAVAKSKTTTPLQTSKLLEAGQKDLLDGKFAQAEKNFRQALTISEKTKNIENQIVSLQLLCDSLEAQRRLTDSEALRKKAMDLALKKYGAESAQYASQLAGMSCYFTKKGDNTQSWSFIEKANAALGKSGGSAAHPLESADCSIATGRIQSLEGSRGLADMSFKKALELKESKLKATDMAVLLICKEYAALLEQMERTDEAKKLKDRLTVASAIGVVTTDDTEPNDVVTDKKNSAFGKLIVEAKKAGAAKDYDKALALWQKAAQICEKSGSKGRLAYVLLKIGDTYSMKKEKDKSTAVYRRSATIREAIKAKDTIGMARVLTRLANVEIVNKNYDEAKRLLIRALEIEGQRKASDIMVECTLRSLSSACMLTKDFSKGEEVCQKLIALADKDSSPIAPMKKAMTTSMLAGIYIQSGRTQEGISMMKNVSGQLTPEAAKEYGKVTGEVYKEVEKEADAAEEKSLGII